MKRKVFALLTIVSSLALSGCSFFNFVNHSESSTDEPWSGEKQQLSYSSNDLSKNHYYDVAYMPSTGNPKLLVLPIAFKDSDKYINDEKKEEILSRLNLLAFGSNEETGWYSISSFYEAESFGACVIQGEVAPWYESNYYYESVNSTEITNNVVKAAYNNWKANNPDRVKDFDSNGDGYIDGVLAIYGGPDYKNATGRARNNTNMWAYTSWLETDSNVETPNANVYIWASYDFMDADNSHDLYVDGHTYIHEMGHVFGLDDYYDYADTDDVWAGGFSMQDYNVGGHDPYSLMTLGWIKPYVPTETATITIKPFESSGDVILLSPDFSANSPYDEYVLIEYYKPTGTNERDSQYQYMNKYPLGPDKEGIRIWHIDSRLIKFKDKRSAKSKQNQYEIVNTITPGDGYYVVGCTNTTYMRDGSTDGYCSILPELRSYRLVELIRKGDYTASKTNEYINNSYLFKSGDMFSLTKYSGYFRNGSKFDNGSRFNWQVTVNSINSEFATITVSL